VGTPRALDGAHRDIVCSVTASNFNRILGQLRTRGSREN
jgi:hypothetical protein